MKAHLTASEVARLLSIDRSTVTRWIKKGLVAGVQRPAGTRKWRIPLPTYEALLKRAYEDS